MALAVCVLLAAAVGGWRSWRNATVDPPAPPPVCPLIRSEVFGLLVPAHGALEAAEQNGPGMRSNYCLARSASTKEGAGASLWVSLARFGRHEGRGPRCLDRDGLRMVINNKNRPVALGDRSVYFLSGDRETGRRINFSTCFGTYGVLVEYEATAVADTAMVESATTAAQEVLSWL
ncbi:hypothetical protein V6V47_11830 [Micromonospora sp. CPCC 205539]|uniref:hypothetical protein n=1 Tax=Micromonospora sp. CPCC 205539 TaxID=3122408 RepID=UPI002FEE927D